MKLVNVHKLNIILVLFVVGLQSAQAQVWTLQQCIDTALIHNRNLRMSRNTISIGEQKVQEAKANLIPKVFANVDYKYYTNLPYQLMPLSTFNPTAAEGQFKEAQFGVPHNMNATLQLSMPLYNPQIYGAIDIANIGSEVTTLQYLRTEEQIFFEISNLYYNAQILHQQLSFIDSNLTNATRLLRNTQLLKEQQLAKGTDVIKVQLQIVLLTTQQESIESKYKQILRAVNFTMGKAIELPIEIDPTIHYHDPEDYRRLSTLDIRITKAQNLLITSEINTLNNSKYLPSVNLIGMFGTTGLGYDKQPNDFLKFYPIGFAGIQFSLPLFNGTVTQRKINQKEFELQNNEIQIELLSEQNSMYVQNATMQRMIALKLFSTSSEQIKLAQVVYDQATLQLSQGTASLTDVLLADNSLREAQQTYLTALVDYLKADLELKKLTGNISIKN